MQRLWLWVINQGDSKLHPMDSQFLIYILLNLCPGSVRGHNIEVLAEDANTGDPSSFTVRMEYLFAFQF